MSNWARLNQHRAGAISDVAARRPAQPTSRPVWASVNLQQALGNQAVQQRAAACPAFAACPTGGACHQCPARVQAKLAISQPGDVHEQEADRIADTVMNSASGPLVGTHTMSQSRILARAAENSAMPTAPAPGTEDIATSTESSVLSSPGAPLPASERTFFEARFGRDFRHVRIHTDGQAAGSARSINALAFTHGNHVVFGAGQYAPGTSAGRRLLAHELAHVVQQTGSGGGAPNMKQIQRAVNPARVSCERFPRTYPIFAAIGTNDPVAVLQAADARAIEMLTNVIDELTHIRARIQAGEPPAWPLIGDALAIAMQRFLRLDPNDPNVWTGNGPGTVEIIIRWYTNVRTILQSGQISYTCLDPDCDPGDWAAAIPGTRRIFLCRPFWRDPVNPLDGRAITIIHEAAHLYYGLEDSGGGPGSAHCLEQFVSEVNGVPIHPDFAGACRAPAP